MKTIVRPRISQLVSLLAIVVFVPYWGFLCDPLQAQEPTPSNQPNEGKGDAAKKSDSDKPPEDKPFQEVVKDMEVISGLFTFYRKADENRLLMEIQPNQLDKTFLFAGSVERAVGERGLYASQMGADFPFYFHQVGKSIRWVVPNTSFTAQKSQPTERSTARSFPEALLGSARTLSKPHPERKSLLIDLADLFLSDLPGLVIHLNVVYQPTVYRFDKPGSALGGIKVFPENVLVDVQLHYVTDNPRTPSVTLPDARSVPIGLKYELSSLKESNYQRRLADDRVGYFMTVHQDFTSDKPVEPYLRYINRWNLEKTDPNAQLSPPKKPIVFWLENTIPLEYREWFKEGVLLYNKAFERIGFKDAIVVKQMPDDADWDPADTRYNTVRWFATVDAAFAIGPSRANPFTGEIYDADIGFSEAIIRFQRRYGEQFVYPVAQNQDLPEPLPPIIWSRHSRLLCNYADGLAQQAAMGMSLMQVRGALTPEMETKLIREFIIEVTAHEVGHTLGLRHNFRASTILKPDELSDTKKTSDVGQSASVMDYNPVVIAEKGEKQGDFVPTTLGTYDYWVIEYGYKPISGDEKIELARIASRAADPLLPYSTDEDALGTVSPQSIDPLANQFDQSSDPIAFNRKRVALVNELWNSMEGKLAKPGEGYQVLRRSIGMGLGEYSRALLTSSKFIGGIYHHRDHVGDPQGRLPFVPVPAEKQREALEFLRAQAFSEKAFQLAPSLHNKLAIDRLHGLDFYSYFTIQRLDYPWHNNVLSIQRALLSRLMHPITLGRILDNELRFDPKERPFVMADLFKGLNGSIWSELDTGAAKITSLRRNLQREQLKQLIRLVVRPAPPPPATPPSAFAPTPIPTPPPPDDATTLARASLVEIQGKIRRVLAARTPTDTTTRAHLQEVQAQIGMALQAQMQRQLD